ncbi:hypothetical protein L9W92_18340 [Pelotomaculum terephthalicicum JT]|uniref:hypothetical protein n=1 Tax=Pelotomaculum terephthalicicum TaxID=206393 RepID=UPI001F03B8B5|nr:hypothetical protein [Pelotomaculum terephthalicicum]MCG9969956.1 hypothetical protein [Pelotomaculum terephthalicicum JT]
MTTLVIMQKAAEYLKFPDKRAIILRLLYGSEGKAGLEALARVIGFDSSGLFMEWVRTDFLNRNRSSRRRRYKNMSPPLPPVAVEISSVDILGIFEESAVVGGGNVRTGKQGGRRSISNGRAWDALRGGGK